MAQRPPSILVVDDSGFTRELMTLFLRQRGYDVRLANDGTTALNMLIIHRPDIVLLDIAIPGIDGFSLCRKIREDAILREIKVILFTAMDYGDNAEKARQAGADAYLSKPIVHENLLAALKSVEPH
ncbi:MAG TPA: response regulator [Elusimicrobiota bacterium]|nr:response regulator [Elusimicrobiota bacterium]